MKFYFRNEGECAFRAGNELTEVEIFLPRRKRRRFQQQVDRIAGIAPVYFRLWELRADLLLVERIAQDVADLPVNAALRPVGQPAFLIKSLIGKGIENHFGAVAQQ